MSTESPDNGGESPSYRKPSKSYNTPSSESPKDTGESPNSSPPSKKPTNNKRYKY